MWSPSRDVCLRASVRLYGLPTITSWPAQTAFQCCLSSLGGVRSWYVYVMSLYISCAVKPVFEEHLSCWGHFMSVPLLQILLYSENCLMGMPQCHRESDPAEQVSFNQRLFNLEKTGHQSVIKCPDRKVFLYRSIPWRHVILYIFQVW